jgi:hypothetical protein
MRSHAAQSSLLGRRRTRAPALRALAPLTLTPHARAPHATQLLVQSRAEDRAPLVAGALATAA